MSYIIHIVEENLYKKKFSNKNEVYKMSDNKIALQKIEKLCKKLDDDKIDFVEFINEFEIVCYNDISSRHLDNFADGWSKATVSSFMKVCLRAFVDEDEMAQSRLIVDLGLEDDVEVEVVRV